MRRLMRRSPLTPQSLRAKGVEKQTEFYAEAQRRVFENALSASGIHGMVYSQKRGGVRCTCAPSVGILTENGEMTEEGVKALETQRHKGYGVESKRIVYNAADLDFDVDLTDFDGEESDNSSDLDEGDWGVESDDLEPFEFGSFGQRRCAVCFGSGYVGGYDLAKGHRMTLDTQVAWVADNLTVNTARQPNVFDVDGQAIVTFDKVMVPCRKNIRLSSFRVMDNDVPLSSRLYNWRNKNELLDSMRDGAAGRMEHRLSLDVSASFTHVELQFSYGHCVLDMAQPQDQFDATMTGPHNSTTFSVSTDTILNKYSIIRENKYNRAWQVMSVTPHHNMGRLVFHEAEARLVAQQEIFHLLPGMN